jgi:putative MFS transporter
MMIGLLALQIIVVAVFGIEPKARRLEELMQPETDRAVERVPVGRQTPG